MSGSGYANAVGCQPVDGLGWDLNVWIWICKRRRLSAGGWAGLGSQCLDLDYVNAVGCRPLDGLGRDPNVWIWIGKRRRLSAGGRAGLGSQCMDLDM